MNPSTRCATRCRNQPHRRRSRRDKSSTIILMSRLPFDPPTMKVRHVLLPKGGGRPTWHSSSHGVTATARDSISHRMRTPSNSPRRRNRLAFHFRYELGCVVTRQRQRDIPHCLVDPGACARVGARFGLRLGIERLEVQEALRERVTSAAAHHCRARHVPTVFRLGRDVANCEAAVSVWHGEWRGSSVSNSTKTWMLRLRINPNVGVATHRASACPHT